MARLSGDEFVIIIDGTTREQIAQLVDRLQQRLAEPMAIRDLIVAIGVAFYPSEANTASTLLSLADRRMYDDKRTRRR